VFVHHTDRFDPAATLELLQRELITTFCAAPTIYRLLVQQDLSSLHVPMLRHCVGAGEPLNPEVIAVWRGATGLTVHDGYGQTETVVLVGNRPGDEVVPGSMGRPMPGLDVAVIDEGGARQPPGEEGEVAVALRPRRPVGLFREYRGDAERTAEAFAGGWYRTGDRARVDESGRFWFVGRADDVITSAAYRIGPFEVESALLEHPAVAESAVVGKPDAVRGQIVKAYVVLAVGHAASDALVAELQDFVRAQTAAYKYPREIEFVDELPKTVSGKIRRVELRERAAREP
jgi:acyl-coenzyme A synthetase/AMP-(fatty) acid ligase